MSEERDPVEGEASSDSFDASDPTQVRDRRRSARVLEDQRAAYFGRMLADPASRRFSWQIISDLHVFNQRFAEPGQPARSEAAWFLLGQREAGLQLFRLFMRHQPALAAQMIAENDRG